MARTYTSTPEPRYVERAAELDGGAITPEQWDEFLEELDERFSAMAELAEKGLRSTELDDPAISNTSYDLGTLTDDIAITLPEEPEALDEVYIAYRNTAGYQVTIPNTVIGDTDIPASGIVELSFKYICNYWVLRVATAVEPE